MKVVHEQFEMIDTNFEALSVAVNIGSYDKRLNSSIQEHLISGIVKRWNNMKSFCYQQLNALMHSNNNNKMEMLLKP